MFNRNKEEDLELAEASRMLENILDSAHMKRTGLPADAMAAYKKRRSAHRRLIRVLLIVIIALVFLIPAFLITPNFTLLEMSGENSDKYEVTVDGFLPVKSVVAGVDGHAVPVTQTSDRVYMVEPDVNGTLEVTVFLFNNHSASKSVVISDLDTEPPEILYDKGDDRFIYLTVTDDRSGVDFDGVRAMDADRNSVRPYSIDEEQGLLTFLFPESSLNIFIPDKSGNTLQVVITV